MTVSVHMRERPPDLFGARVDKPQPSLRWESWNLQRGRLPVRPRGAVDSLTQRRLESYLRRCPLNYTPSLRAALAAMQVHPCRTTRSARPPHEALRGQELQAEMRRTSQTDSAQGDGMG